MTYEERYNAAKETGEVKNLTPVFVEFKDKGQSVVGRLINTQEVESKLSPGSYLQYVMETDDGLIKYSLGQATDKEMEGVLMPGGVYMIEFLGKTKLAGGRSVNKYQIDEVPWMDTDKVGGKDDNIPETKEAKGGGKVDKK